jgi:hypothetical protein
MQKLTFLCIFQASQVEKAGMSGIESTITFDIFQSFNHWRVLKSHNDHKRVSFYNRMLELQRDCQRGGKKSCKSLSIIRITWRINLGDCLEEWVALKNESPWAPTNSWLGRRFFSNYCIKVNKVLWPPLNLYGCGSTIFETADVAQPLTRRLGDWTTLLTPLSFISFEAFGAN